MSDAKAPAVRQRVILVTVLIGALGLAFVFLIAQFAAPGIDANAQRYAMRYLDRLIAPDTYTNQPANDVLVVRDPDLLGGDAPRLVYRAFDGNRAVALAIETVAPGGYSGPIELLVAISANGQVSGVEVTDHRETVNLGDQIAAENSDWVQQFAGRSLNDPERARWAVRKDEGDFDQFTGATVSPRAVVAAVRDALIYFELNRDALFAHPEPPAAP